MSEKKRVSIIGGGISGLTLAYELQKHGFAIEIFEKKSWGGLIHTKITPEMQIESAANAFLNSEKLQEISREIGCQLTHTLDSAKKRYIYRSKPKRWPLSLKTTLLLIFKYIPRFIFNIEKSKPQKLESVEKYVTRVMNQEILDYLISPAFQGIYAGDVRVLSASLLFGPIFKAKNKNVKIKKGSVSPLGGMSEFIVKLKSYLEKQGVVFHLKEISNLEKNIDPVVLAVPPWELAKIYDPDWGQVNKLGLLRVTVCFENPKFKINGFGILFPEKEKFHCLGVLSNTEIFKNRGPLYNESWILGGARSPELLQLTDTEIIKLIYEDRARALGAQDRIKNFEIIRWPSALTHYDLKLEEFLNQYKEKKPNIYITGNYLGNLGLSRILEQNEHLAEKIRDDYA